MKRFFIVISSILLILFSLSTLPEAPAKEKSKAVLLSTLDIDEDYEILGLVYYQSSKLELQKVHDELKKQAEKMGADYVIGVTYFSHAGYLYGSGTAVRLISKPR